MKPRQLGKIDDSKVAFWHIARFLSQQPSYRGTPFGNVLRLQQSIARGKYCCLGDGKAVQAVATWQDVNVERLLQTFPRYVAEASETTDGVFLTSLVATDRDSLKIMTSHLKRIFAGKDVYWHRHKGKLGHRKPSPTGSPADH